MGSSKISGGSLLARSRSSTLEREHAAEQLARQGPEPRRRLHRADDERAPEHRREHGGSLEREPRLRQLSSHLRQQRQHLGKPRGPAEEPAFDGRRPEPLPLGPDAQLTARKPHGAGPGIRAVDEDAVRERHPAEADLVVVHPPERSRSNRRGRGPLGQYFSLLPYASPRPSP